MIDLNKRRAKRAAAVLRATRYRVNGLEWSSAIGDCLKDLRHLADSKKLDFEAIVDFSEDAYDQEVAEDSLPYQRIPKSDALQFEAEFVEVPVSEVDYAGQYDCDRPQAKSLAKQTFDDFDQLFRDCEGLTYVFLATGPQQVNTAFPDVISAAALAKSAFQGSSYDPRYTEAQFSKAGFSYLIPKARVPQEVAARIREMKRRKAKFVLIWNVAGSSTVNVEGDLNRFADEIVDLLATELQQLLL